MLHRYHTDGTYLGNSGFGHLGFDSRGVALDESRDRVYVVDALNSDIDVFNQAGEHLFSFGSEGRGSGQFTGGARQVTVDVDGNVWAADYGGSRTLKFDPDGNPLLSAPTASGYPEPGLLGQPRDVAVDEITGDVWVADTWNQRFQQFAPTGELLNAYGQRGPSGPLNMVT